MKKAFAQKHQYQTDKAYIEQLEALEEKNRQFIEKIQKLARESGASSADSSDSDNIDEEQVSQYLKELDPAAIRQIRELIAQDDEMVVYFEGLIESQQLIIAKIHNWTLARLYGSALRVAEPAAAAASATTTTNDHHSSQTQPSAHALVSALQAAVKAHFTKTLTQILNPYLQQFKPTGGAGASASQAATTHTQPQSVFISYAWAIAGEPNFDYAKYKRYEGYVERLAEALEALGLTVYLDRWYDRGNQPLTDFLELMDKADVFIPIGTPLYLFKYERRQQKTSQREHVVQVEGKILNYIASYSHAWSSKIYPLCLEGTPEESLPLLLRPQLGYRLCPIEDNFFDVLFKLVRDMHHVDPRDAAYNKIIDEFNAVLMAIADELQASDQAAKFNQQQQRKRAKSQQKAQSLAQQAIESILGGESSDESDGEGDSHNQPKKSANAIAPLIESLDTTGASDGIGSEKLQQKALFTWLKQSYRGNNKIEAIFGESYSLDREYINLHMLCNTKTSDKPVDLRISSFEDLFKDKRTIKLEQLFDSDESIARSGSNGSMNLEKPTRVIVDGRAGIGKTTLVNYIAYAWANDQLFQQFEWLFVLKIRKLYQLQSSFDAKTSHGRLSSWIFDSLFQGLEEMDNEQFHDFWQKVIASSLQQGKILLVLDGYDELPQQHSYKTVISAIVSQGAYANCPVIITSRPHASLGLNVDRRVEIVGFVDNNIKQYTKIYFGDVTTANSLIATWRKNPCLWGCAHVPVILNMMCGLAEDSLDATASQVVYLNSTQTMTGLYLALVKLLTQRKAITTNTFPDDEISLLCAIAFNSYKDNVNLIIKPECIEVAARDTKLTNNYQLLLKNILNLGLLKGISVASQTQLLPGKRNKIKVAYEFIHLTFQEFFVAKYIVQQLASEKNEAINKFIIEHKYHSRFLIIWWFVAGLLKDHKTQRENFFMLLESKPIEVMGFYQLALIIRCFDEAREQIDQHADFCNKFNTTLEKYFTANSTFLNYTFKPYLVKEIAISPYVRDKFMLDRYDTVFKSCFDESDKLRVTAHSCQVLNNLLAMLLEIKHSFNDEWLNRCERIVTLILDKSANEFSSLSRPMPWDGLKYSATNKARQLCMALKQNFGLSIKFSEPTDSDVSSDKHSVSSDSLEIATQSVEEQTNQNLIFADGHADAQKLLAILAESDFGQRVAIESFLKKLLTNDSQSLALLLRDIVEISEAQKFDIFTLEVFFSVLPNLFILDQSLACDLFTLYATIEVPRRNSLSMRSIPSISHETRIKANALFHIADLFTHDEKRARNYLTKFLDNDQDRIIRHSALNAIFLIAQRSPKLGYTLFQPYIKDNELQLSAGYFKLLLKFLTLHYKYLASIFIKLFTPHLFRSFPYYPESQFVLNFSITAEALNQIDINELFVKNNSEESFATVMFKLLVFKSALNGLLFTITPLVDKKLLFKVQDKLYPVNCGGEELENIRGFYKDFSSSNSSPSFFTSECLGYPGNSAASTTSTDIPGSMSTAQTRSQIATTTFKETLLPETSTFNHCLPSTLNPGKAIDNGDCFFDAFAQCINQINQTDVNTIKTVRMVCYDFYSKNMPLVDEWNRAEYGGIDSGEDGYYFIQYTAEECELHFHGRAPIWGRPIVEGRILCREYQLECILVIEMVVDPETKQAIPGYYRATADAYKSIDENEAKSYFTRAEIPKLMVEQNTLHFVPLVHSTKPKLENDEDLSSSSSSLSGLRMSKPTEGDKAISTAGNQTFFDNRSSSVSGRSEMFKSSQETNQATSSLVSEASKSGDGMKYRPVISDKSQYPSLEEALQDVCRYTELVQPYLNNIIMPISSFTDKFCKLLYAIAEAFYIQNDKTPDESWALDKNVARVIEGEEFRHIYYLARYWECRVAVCEGQTEVLERLLRIDSFRKSINELLADGKSLLHIAASLQNESIIEILINAGANPYLPDSEGRRPFSLAPLSQNERWQESYPKLSPHNFSADLPIPSGLIWQHKTAFAKLFDLKGAVYVYVREKFPRLDRNKGEFVSDIYLGVVYEAATGLERMKDQSRISQVTENLSQRLGKTVLIKQIKRPTVAKTKDLIGLSEVLELGEIQCQLVKKVQGIIADFDLSSVNNDRIPSTQSEAESQKIELLNSLTENQRRGFIKLGAIYPKVLVREGFESYKDCAYYLLTPNEQKLLDYAKDWNLHELCLLGNDNKDFLNAYVITISRLILEAISQKEIDYDPNMISHFSCTPLDNALYLASSKIVYDEGLRRNVPQRQNGRLVYMLINEGLRAGPEHPVKNSQEVSRNTRSLLAQTSSFAKSSFPEESVPHQHPNFRPNVTPRQHLDADAPIENSKHKAAKQKQGEIKMLSKAQAQQKSQNHPQQATTGALILHRPGEVMFAEDRQQNNLLLNAAMNAVFAKPREWIDKQVSEQVILRLVADESAFDEKVIKALNEHRAWKSKTDNYGNNLFHWLAITGRLGLASAFKSAPIKMDTANQFGLSPVHMAVVFSQTAALRYFAECGLSRLKSRVHYKSLDGTSHELELSPFHLAVFLGREEQVSWYLNQRDDVEVDVVGFGNVFHLAVCSGQTAVLKMLLTHPKLRSMGHPSAWLQSPLVIEHHFSVLSYAAATNRPWVVYELMRAYETDANLKGSRLEQGQNALIEAVRWGALDAVQMLLELHVSPDFSFHREGSSGSRNVSLLGFAEECRDKQTPNTESYECQDDIVTHLENAQRGSIENRYKILEVKQRHVRNLVFQGGGIKGLAYVGAYRAFCYALPKQTSNPRAIEQIERVSGTSAGAIFAAALALGFTAKQLEGLMKTAPFAQFLDDIKPEVLRAEGFWKKARGLIDDMVGLGGQIVTFATHPLLYSQQILSTNGLSKGEVIMGWLSKIMATHLLAIRDEEKEKMNRENKPDNLIISTINRIHGLERATDIDIDQVIKEGLKEEQLLKLTFGQLNELVKADNKRFKHLYTVALRLQGRSHSDNNAETDVAKEGLEVMHSQGVEGAEWAWSRVLVIDAVRASMSIPMAFVPHQVRECNEHGLLSLHSNNYYVDGGALKNFPIELFDKFKYLPSFAHGYGEKPESNPFTIGFRLVTPEKNKQEEVGGLLKRMQQKLGGALANIKEGIERNTAIGFLQDLTSLYYHAEDIIAEFQNVRAGRTIEMSNGGISTLKFNLSADERNGLIANGEKAIKEAYNEVNFADYESGTMSQAGLIAGSDSLLASATTPSNLSVQNTKRVNNDNDDDDDDNDDVATDKMKKEGGKKKKGKEEIVAIETQSSESARPKQ